MNAAHKLHNGSDVVLIVKGEDTGTEFGPFKGFSGTVLGHEGNGLVKALKVSAGENYAEQPAEQGGGFVIVNGTKVFHDVPHGDVRQGDTFVFFDELPAGFPRG